jgi:hypothetical protein
VGIHRRFRSIHRLCSRDHLHWGLISAILRFTKSLETARKDGLFFIPKFCKNGVRFENRNLIDNGILKLNVEWAAKDNEAPVAKKASDSKTKTLGFKRRK